MTESEKAKAYDRALELAKGALEQYEKPEYKDVLPYAKADLELMFPELAESEDEKNERIRLGILEVLKTVPSGLFEEKGKITLDEAFYWLERKEYEKQGEQKTVEWSEEDEQMIEDILDAIDSDIAASDYHDMENWLKSLRPQKQCGYNPYKEVVESIAEMCEKYTSPTSNLSDFLDNVKVKCKDAKEYDSLFPQKQWKPSEEQMVVINDTIRFLEDKSDSLNSDYLYNKMKEIRENLKAL